MNIEAHLNSNKDLLVTVSDRTQEWVDICVGVPAGEKPVRVQSEIEAHIGRELMSDEASALAEAIKGAKVTDGIAAKE